MVTLLMPPLNILYQYVYSLTEIYIRCLNKPIQHIWLYNKKQRRTVNINKNTCIINWDNRYKITVHLQYFYMNLFWGRIFIVSKYVCDKRIFVR